MMTKNQIKSLLLTLFGLEVAYSGLTKEFHPVGEPTVISKSWLLKLLSKHPWTIESISQFLYKYEGVRLRFQAFKTKPVINIESNLSELYERESNCLEKLNRELNEQSQLKEALEAEWKEYNAWYEQALVNPLISPSKSKYLKCRHKLQKASMAERVKKADKELKLVRAEIVKERKRLKADYLIITYTSLRRGVGNNRRRRRRK